MTQLQNEMLSKHNEFMKGVKPKQIQLNQLKRRIPKTACYKGTDILYKAPHKDYGVFNRSIKNLVE